LIVTSELHRRFLACYAASFPILNIKVSLGTTVLEVRGGIVDEIGIAAEAPSASRKPEPDFLHSFA
jgi:hypothetical protein